MTGDGGGDAHIGQLLKFPRQPLWCNISWREGNFKIRPLSKTGYKKSCQQTWGMWVAKLWPTRLELIWLESDNNKTITLSHSNDWANINLCVLYIHCMKSARTLSLYVVV